MRAAHRDLRPLKPLVHAGDVHADAIAVGVVFAGHLLLRRENCLHRAEVDVDHPRVGTLLDHARDDVALAALELSEHVVVRNVAQALVDHLLRSEGSDAPEVARAVLGFADDVAVFVVLRHPHRHVAGLAVELHARRNRVARLVIGRTRVLEVSGEDGLLDDVNEFVEGDLALALHEPQHAQVNVH
jgi:hypothetical protein